MSGGKGQEGSLDKGAHHSLSFLCIVEIKYSDKWNFKGAGTAFVYSWGTVYRSGEVTEVGAWSS